MIQYVLDLGYQVTAVCREKSVGKLDAFMDRIAVFPDNNIFNSIRYLESAKYALSLAR